MQPHLLERGSSFLYAWALSGAADDCLPALADGLYQFGRGVDPAWATGEMLDDEQLTNRLRMHGGPVYRPSAGVGAIELAVPTTNSFTSIVRRFEAALVRLQVSADGKTNFVQPPKVHFAIVRYDGTPTFHLFEMRSEQDPAKLSPWATWRSIALIERVRDTAVATLKRVLAAREADIERVLVGRKRDGAGAGHIEERVRFIPLPSIGHRYADQFIRRVLVQVPAGPLSELDILWALRGRPLFDSATGEVGDTMLAEAVADDMVDRYRGTARTWRSVTPLALGSAARRRIEPTRQGEEAKSSTERDTEERAARHGVAQALRHAGIMASPVRVQVQREPFDVHGTRAERFAAGTRFAKEALWHVEMELDREVRGPVVLGDGRFLGLGVMVPKIDHGVYALRVERGLRDGVDVAVLARALRRAVMARVQAVVGQADLPPYFHGHEPDGRPLRAEYSKHLAFVVDLPRSRLLIVPPHVLDRRRALREEESHLEVLEHALDGFTELRVGAEGVCELRRASFGVDDDLSYPSKHFQSVTDYVVTRHAKRMSADDVVTSDVQRECERCGLPVPVVRVVDVRGVPSLGAVARVEIGFLVAVPGPIILGKTRYFGGGLFAPTGHEPHVATGPRRTVRQR